MPSPSTAVTLTKGFNAVNTIIQTRSPDTEPCHTRNAPTLSAARAGRASSPAGRRRGPQQKEARRWSDWPLGGLLANVKTPSGSLQQCRCSLLHPVHGHADHLHWLHKINIIEMMFHSNSQPDRCVCSEVGCLHRCQCEITVSMQQKVIYSAGPPS